MKKKTWTEFDAAVPNQGRGHKLRNSCLGRLTRSLTPMSLPGALDLKTRAT